MKKIKDPVTGDIITVNILEKLNRHDFYEEENKELKDKKKELNQTIKTQKLEIKKLNQHSLKLSDSVFEENNKLRHEFEILNDKYRKNVKRIFRKFRQINYIEDDVNNIVCYNLLLHPVER